MPVILTFQSIGMEQLQRVIYINDMNDFSHLTCDLMWFIAVSIINLFDTASSSSFWKLKSQVINIISFNTLLKQVEGVPYTPCTATTGCPIHTMHCYYRVSHTLLLQGVPYTPCTATTGCPINTMHCDCPINTMCCNYRVSHKHHALRLSHKHHALWLQGVPYTPCAVTTGCNMKIAGVHFKLIILKSLVSSVKRFSYHVSSIYTDAKLNFLTVIHFEWLKHCLPIW